MSNSSETASDAGHADPVSRARALIDEHDRIGLDALSARVGLSPHALRRRFLARFGLSPAAYAKQRRFQRLRERLRDAPDVTAAVYEAGFGSSSGVYAEATARLGMTPLEFRRGGAGLLIHHAQVASPLGLVLVAATCRGVCWIAFGQPAARLEAELADAFPAATLQRLDAGRDGFLAPRIDAVCSALAGDYRGQVEVELIGTAFQHRVWKALMQVPPGATRSYAGLARAVGQPTAVRAVARACASNRVAVLVPCHRVLRSDGSLGGYRWGMPAKRALLERESNG